MVGGMGMMVGPAPVVAGVSSLGMAGSSILVIVDGLGLGASTSEWVAYLTDDNWGIGIYTPGTTNFTVYRALGNGSTGESGSACSYVAPLRTFALTGGLEVKYDVYLTIGTLDEIEQRFNALK